MGETAEEKRNEGKVEDHEKIKKEEKHKEDEGGDSKKEEKSKDKKKKKDKDGKDKEDKDGDGKEKEKKKKNPEDKNNPDKLRSKLEKIETKMKDLAIKKEEILNLLKQASPPPAADNPPQPATA